MVITLSNFQSEIDNSVLKLLSFKTFDNFLRVLVSVLENLVSKKMYQFQFLKIWSRKKVSVSVSENLLWEKKSWYWCQSKFVYCHSVLTIRHPNPMTREVLVSIHFNLFFLLYFNLVLVSIRSPPPQR